MKTSLQIVTLQNTCWNLVGLIL